MHLRCGLLPCCCGNSGGKIGFLVDHSDRQSNEWFSHYSSICPSQNFTIDAFLTECRHHNCSFAANLGNILISGSRSVELKSEESWLWGTVVILFSKTGFVVFTDLQKTKIWNSWHRFHKSGKKLKCYDLLMWRVLDVALGAVGGGLWAVSFTLKPLVSMIR